MKPPAAKDLPITKRYSCPQCSHFLVSVKFERDPGKLEINLNCRWCERNNPAFKNVTIRDRKLVGKERRLTVKQTRFIEAYCGKARFNSTEAARLAGYSGNNQSLATIGYENMRKHEIRTRIDEKLAENTLREKRE